MTEEKKQEISDAVIKDDAPVSWCLCVTCSLSRLVDRQREVIAKLQAEIAALKGDR